MHKRIIRFSLLGLIALTSAHLMGMASFVNDAMSDFVVRGYLLPLLFIVLSIVALVRLQRFMRNEYYLYKLVGMRSNKILRRLIAEKMPWVIFFPAVFYLICISKGIIGGMISAVTDTVLILLIIIGTFFVQHFVSRRTLLSGTVIVSLAVLIAFVVFVLVEYQSPELDRVSLRSIVESIEKTALGQFLNRLLFENEIVLFVSLVIFALLVVILGKADDRIPKEYVRSSHTLKTRKKTRQTIKKQKKGLEILSEVQPMFRKPIVIIPYVLLFLFYGSLLWVTIIIDYGTVFIAIFLAAFSSDNAESLYKERAKYREWYILFGTDHKRHIRGSLLAVAMISSPYLVLSVGALIIKKENPLILCLSILLWLFALVFHVFCYETELFRKKEYTTTVELIRFFAYDLMLIVPVVNILVLVRNVKQSRKVWEENVGA